MTTETFDQVDSTELFNTAMNDDPIVQDAPEPETIVEQPRGPDGKFAAKVEAEPEPQPTQADPGKDEANVPSWRLREISEERRQAQSERDAARNEAAQFRQQMEQMQRQLQANAPKPEPVDFYADQDAWIKQQLSPFEQRMQSMQTNLMLRASRAENIAIHGRDAVAAAETAIDEAVKSRNPDIPALTARLKASDDPVGVAIEWHKSQSMLKETGGDLNAYREKALEAALNDPAFLAKAMERARTQAGQPQAPNIKLPPSLNRTTSAASPHEAAGDMSDASLFAHATQ